MVRLRRKWYDPVTRLDVQGLASHGGQLSHGNARLLLLIFVKFTGQLQALQRILNTFRNKLDVNRAKKRG